MTADVPGRPRVRRRFVVLLVLALVGATAWVMSPSVYKTGYHEIVYMWWQHDEVVALAKHVDRVAYDVERHLGVRRYRGGPIVATTRGRANHGEHNKGLIALELGRPLDEVLQSFVHEVAHRSTWRVSERRHVRMLNTLDEGLAYAVEADLGYRGGKHDRLRAVFAHRDFTELDLALDRDALEGATCDTFMYIAGETLVAALRDIGGQQAPMRVMWAARPYRVTGEASPRKVWGHLLAAAGLPPIDVLDAAYRRQMALALDAHRAEADRTPRLLAQRVRDADGEALEISLRYGNGAPEPAKPLNRYGAVRYALLCEFGVGEGAFVASVVDGRCRVPKTATGDLPVMLLPDGQTRFVYAERRVPLSTFSWERPTLPRSPPDAVLPVVEPIADGGAAGVDAGRVLPPR